LKEKKGNCLIILGYDHRHNSKAFAHSAAQVYSTYGHRVRVFPKVVPTPFVPSSIQCSKEKVELAVMVTASHNPRKDNGYKVYGGNGAQIGDKVAKEISEFIKRERPNYEKIKKSEKFECSNDQELLKMVMEWYVNNLKSFLKGFPKSLNMPRVVYTALHGVGAEYVEKVFEEIFGQRALIHVPEQKDPDADFPTVDFPNPEEGRSTLSLAMKLAEAEGVKYIFANDPDADRFCVAERLSDNDDSCGGCESRDKWKIFNGNEIAVLLADFISSVSKIEKCAMLASCVSSRFLKVFCENRGWIFESTMTGFKNLGNRGLELKGQGIKVLLAYEEAIGFQVGDWNFDKDGISSLIVFYALIQNIEGFSLQNKLKYIYEREKCWPVQCNGYYFCKPASRIKTILQAIDPKTLLDTTKSFKNENGVVTVEFDVEGFGEAWLMLRSSGTEPKLKYYSELTGSTEKIEAEGALERAVDELIGAMILPNINNLIKKK
jgi:phosphomannomutase